MNIKKFVSQTYPFCIVNQLIQKFTLTDPIKEGLKDAPAIYKEIQNVMLDRYIKVTITCMTAEPIFMLIAYVVLFENSSFINANIWLGMAFVGAALKMVTSWFYNKGYRKEDHHYWLTIVYIRILVMGIVYGSLASIFMPTDSTYAQLIISLLIFSIAAWFTSSLAGVIRGYFLLLLTIFVPYGIWLASHNSNMYFSIIIICCWIIMMMATVSVMRNLLVTSLFLRHQVEDLLKDSQNTNRELLKEISIRKEAEIKLANLASHDALTGLPNRSYFQAYLNEVCEKLPSSGEMIAILFIDLDKFKPVNDLLGHEVGDLLLIEVGQRLKNSIRTSDMAARLGGDEFIMIITNVKSSADLKMVTEKIRVALNKPFNINNQNIDVTPSIGVSLFPQDDSDIARVIKKADEAMYKSKNLGGNKVAFFHDLLTT